MRITTKQGAIHQSCKRLNISRDELARRMGVSTATAYRVDAGKTDPSPQFIAALMISTGATFEDLFDITGTDAVPAGEPAEALAG